MNNLFYLMPVLLALILLMRFVLGQASKRGPAAKYRRRPIMTENELEFFGRLVAALPEHYIFPQVAMSALIESANTDRKQAFGDRQRIAQQRIDYVVCNKRCEVVAVVELDDRSHSKVKDKVRDERLEQGGYRTVRFQSRQKPPAIAIRAAVLPPAVSPAVSPAGSVPAAGAAEVQA